MTEQCLDCEAVLDGGEMINCPALQREIDVFQCMNEQQDSMNKEELKDRLINIHKKMRDFQSVDVAYLLVISELNDVCEFFDTFLYD